MKTSHGRDQLIAVIPDATVVVSGITAYLFDRYAPIFTMPRVFGYCGWIVVLAGMFFALRLIALIRRENTTSNVTDIPPDLMRGGVYSFSRNPFYLSYVFIAVGVALILGSLGAFAGVVLCIVVLNGIVRLEERKLRSAFGREYEQYVRSVRRWL